MIMMKTIADKTTRDELIHRIQWLNVNATAQWGKMNVHQMVKHCSLWEEMMMGRRKYKRNWLGYLFGKIALKGLVKDEKHMGRNAPTIAELKVKETGDFETEKARWVSLMEEYDHLSGPEILHPFFGKMTREQMGYLIYKHTDHHLRQFNG
jgi:hypothetical protein